MTKADERRRAMLLDYCGDVYPEVYAELEKRMVKDGFHSDLDYPVIVMTVAIAMIENCFDKLNRHYPQAFRQSYPEFRRQMIDAIDNMKP